MKIKKAEIRYLFQNQISNNTLGDTCHTKVLPWLSIAQALEGSYELRLGNGPFQSTGEGGFFVAPSHIQQTIMHRANQETGRIHCRWVFLDVVVNDTYRLDEWFTFPSVLRPEESAELGRLFNGLFEATTAFARYAYCYQILDQLFRLAVPKDDHSLEKLQGTLEYIRNHYAEPITVADLARNACMSQSNFFALFKKGLDISPMAYINHYRLSLAVEQLTRSNRSIQEIAHSVGINDPLYFSRMFEKVYHTSPRRYRKVYMNR
ncbi:MAG: helix-turn-helix transcriptional regulator [Clostridia bacterium]|nr:helix-turn-helix transcriptional regulator [Clostridia bacterium]